MRIVDQPLPGVLVLEPRASAIRADSFSKRYRQDRLAEVGITDRFVQANQSGPSRHAARAALAVAQTAGEVSARGLPD